MTCWEGTAKIEILNVTFAGAKGVGEIEDKSEGGVMNTSDTAVLITGTQQGVNSTNLWPE